MTFTFSSASKYAEVQTPEASMRFVLEDPMSLQDVHVQTTEICLAAVRQNGLALKHVVDQTPEICLAAVRQNGFALKFVNYPPTPEIIAEALKQLADTVASRDQDD
jgi:hypothetical protein